MVLLFLYKIWGTGVIIIVGTTMLAEASMRPDWRPVLLIAFRNVLDFTGLFLISIGFAALHVWAVH